MSYEDMTNAELTNVYNDMCGPGEHIKAWKGKKSDLIAKIEKLEQEGSLPKPEPEPELPIGDEPNKPKTTWKGTVRETALELLCEVDYYEDRGQDSGPANRVPYGHKNARSVGFTYQSIIDRILELSPVDEKGRPRETSAACLRWYSVKVRDGETGYEGYTLAQRRPRPKMPKRSK